jgi:hypothetical protein
MRRAASRVNPTNKVCLKCLVSRRQFSRAPSFKNPEWIAFALCCCWQFSPSPGPCGQRTTMATNLNVDATQVTSAGPQCTSLQLSIALWMVGSSPPSPSPALVTTMNLVLTTPVLARFCRMDGSSPKYSMVHAALSLRRNHAHLC